MDKQLIQIPLIQGVDTKTNSKVVEHGKLLRCENGVFTEHGSVKKRTGFHPLTKAVRDAYSESEISEGFSLGNYKDQLLLFDGTNSYSYVEAGPYWKDVGNVVSCSVSTSRITNSPYTQHSPSYGRIYNIGVYAWIDTRGGAWATVIDEDTGFVINKDVLVESTATVVKAVSLEDSVLLFYDKDNDVSSRSVCVKIITKTKHLVFEEAVLYTTLKSSKTLLDANPYRNNRSILVFLDTDDCFRVAFINSLGNIVTGGDNDPIQITPAATPANAIAICPQVTNVAIAYSTATTVQTICVASALFDVVYSERALDTGLSDVKSITGVTSGTTVRWFYDQEAVLPYNNFVKTNTVSVTGTVGTPTVCKRSVSLATKAFVRDSEDVWVGVVYQSDLQATYFLINHEGVIGASWKQKIAGSSDISSLSDVVESETDTFHFANTSKTKLYSENGDVYTLDNISAVSVDFTAEPNYSSTELGDSLFLAGGIIQSYDGYQFTEHGFLLYPENLSASVTSSDGYLQAGSYLYKAIYEWTDTAGQIHRSGTSVPLTVSVASNNSKVTLTVPTLRLTHKTNISIVLYRTEVNADSIYYRISPIANGTINDPSADTVTVIDRLADTSIYSNEILYTDGISGELDHLEPPGASLLLATKNRLWLAGMENPKQLMYSMEHFDGEGLNFTESFTLETTDKITALSELDDKVIVFMASRIAYTGEGPGPDSTGNGEFTLRYISSDVGCENPNSIVKSDLGVFFQSNKGIYLLGRDLNLVYVGAAVERYNAYTVTAGVLLPDTNQVRFTTNDDICLVYDTLFQQWSTFTNYSAVDATTWKGIFVKLRETGEINKEEPGWYFDNAYPIKLLIETSWFKFNGLHGMQRLYWIYILGEYRTAHKLIVDAAYNYQSFNSERHTFNTTVSMPETYFGDNNYGEDPFGGSNDAVYQFSFRPSQGRCNSVKFTFSDQSSEGEAYSINNLAFVVGISGNRPKIGNGKII